tara:strand:- start:959 stop:1624 length:666 start_codon:yes stop_codon:yes gene_type:complete
MGFSPALIFEPFDFVHYEQALRWQTNWQNQLINSPKAPSGIWFLEHSLCFTLGKSSDRRNLLFDIKNSNHDVFLTNRGGEVTCHLPGQLVVYLVIDLSNFQKDLDWYLRKLESVLIDTLKNLGVKGSTIEDITGVWVQDKKVGSIGIGCKRWITLHGLSLNVNCDLKPFELIIPCGLKNYKIGNLSDFLPGISLNDVKPILKKSVEKHFLFDWLNEDKLNI